MKRDIFNQIRRKILRKLECSYQSWLGVSEPHTRRSTQRSCIPKKLQQLHDMSQNQLKPNLLLQLKERVKDSEVKLLHECIHIEPDFIFKELVFQGLLARVGTCSLKALLVLTVVLSHLPHLGHDLHHDHLYDHHLPGHNHQLWLGLLDRQGRAYHTSGTTSPCHL